MSSAKALPLCRDLELLGGMMDSITEDVEAGVSTRSQRRDASLRNGDG